MRRILPTALATAVLVGAFAGVASARLDTEPRERPELAPMRAPAAMPREDADQPGAYGFRSSAAIARDMAGPAPAQPSAGAGAASASVTVTATVLPVVTIVVDDGDVVELSTNTPDRSARGVLFLVRDDSRDGERRSLDAATWADARAALAGSRAGVGTIWPA